MIDIDTERSYSPDYYFIFHLIMIMSLFNFTLHKTFFISYPWKRKKLHGFINPPILIQDSIGYSQIRVSLMNEGGLH